MRARHCNIHELFILGSHPLSLYLNILFNWKPGYNPDVSQDIPFYTFMEIRLNLHNTEV